MSQPQSTMSQTVDPCGTLSEQVEGFLTRLAAEGKSPLTIDCYRRDLARLAVFAGDVPAAGITADLLARFLVSDVATRARDGRVRGEASLGRTKACLRSFGRFLADVGATGRNPAARVRVRTADEMDTLPTPVIRYKTALKLGPVLAALEVARATP